MDRNIEAKQNFRKNNMKQNLQLSKEEFDLVEKIKELKVKIEQQSLFIKTLMEEKNMILTAKQGKIFQESIIKRTQRELKSIQWVVGDMVFTYEKTKDTEGFKTVKNEIKEIIERNEFKIKPITTRIDKAKELEQRIINEFKDKNEQLSDSLKKRGVFHVGNTVDPKQKL